MLRFSPPQKAVCEPIESTTLDDSLSTNPAGFTTDGKTLTGKVVSEGKDARSITRTLRPSSLRAMAEVPGVGAAKLERYGDAFLDVILDGLGRIAQ